MTYKIREYANGLKLILRKMEGVSSASLGLWVNTGSRNETVRNNGVSHFLEHLLFKGSRRYTNDEIKETIEGRGGVLNAFTSEENTCYYAKFLGRHMKKVADVLSDMVLFPTLQAQEIDKERTVIIEEIKMYKDMPVFQAAEIFDEIMWPGHALGRNIAGNADIISKIPREEIASYHASWYQPSSVVVSAAGDLDEAELEAFVVKIFGRVASGRELPIDLYQETVRDPRVKIVSKDIEQTHLNIGFPALSRSHKDRFILAVLNVILGGNMSSRLFNEVREKKGLAYDIASHAKRLKDCGVFYVHAGVDHRNLSQAAEVIIRELERVRTDLVPAPELRRAKEYLIAQSKMSLDDTMEHMLWMGDSLMNTGEVQTREEVAAAIARVTASDVRRVAGFLIDWRWVRVAAVGPGIEEQADRIRGMVLKG